MNATETTTAPTTQCTACGCDYTGPTCTICGSAPIPPAPTRPTVHALPRNLARLADHAGDNHRFSMNAVRVKFDGATYTAEATDTKVLVRVTGETVVASDDFPHVPDLASAPNGATSALVPSATWKKAFTSAKKLRNAHAGVGVVTGERVTTFGTTDGSASAVESAENVEGRFPPTDAIVNEVKRNNKHFSVSFDPKLLAELLKTLAELTTDGKELGRVTFKFGDTGSRAVLIESRSATCEVTAIVMPLSE